MAGTEEATTLMVNLPALGDDLDVAHLAQQQQQPVRQSDDVAAAAGWLREVEQGSGAMAGSADRAFPLPDPLQGCNLFEGSLEEAEAIDAMPWPMAPRPSLSYVAHRTALFTALQEIESGRLDRLLYAGVPGGAPLLPAEAELPCSLYLEHPPPDMQLLLPYEQQQYAQQHAAMHFKQQHAGHQCSAYVDGGEVGSMQSLLLASITVDEHLCHSPDTPKRQVPNKKQHTKSSAHPTRLATHTSLHSNASGASILQRTPSDCCSAEPSGSHEAACTDHEAGGHSSPQGEPAMSKRHVLTLEELRTLFLLPVEKARAEVNLSKNAFQKLLLKHGFKRWPQRQLVGLMNLLANTVEDATLTTEVRKERIARMKLNMDALIEGREVAMFKDLKKMSHVYHNRQHQSKNPVRISRSKSDDESGQGSMDAGEAAETLGGAWGLVAEMDC